MLPGGKQADDPLANVRAATRWLESLPSGDAFKCQQAIFTILKRFNETSTDFTKDRLAILMLLDEKSHDLQDTLAHQYLRNPRMSRPMESQLWHAIYGLHWEVARGYHAFAQHLIQNAGKDAHLPLITLRAIRAFGQLMKWRAIRYLAASEKLWLRLHGFYLLAETSGFHQHALKAYDSDETGYSCETAYLHILMLNLAHSGTLYPRQLDMLDRWLCAWHSQFKLDPQPNVDIHNFVVDLSADHGPRRIRKLDADRPMRFWSTAGLLAQLQTIQSGLKAGRPPAQLALAGSARIGESLELIDHLLRQWAPLGEREQRRAPRASIKRLVDVVHGLNAIGNQIKLASTPATVSPYGIGLNYKEADDVQVYGFITDRTRDRASQMQIPAPRSPDVESWVMHDESECGYGAVVESRDKDWLRVGALIGIKSQTSQTWQVGIVRRLSRQGDDSSAVGIEIVSTSPALALLYDAAGSDYTISGGPDSGGDLPHPGLLLAGDNAAGSVIIDPVDYLPAKVFELRSAAQTTFIALCKPIERSEGWIHVATEPVSG